MGGETLGLNSLAVGPGDDEDLAIGQDSIHVEDEDFDFLSAFFSSHPSMIS
jgi:hypothetical protein